jgi:hypothetical protein
VNGNAFHKGRVRPSTTRPFPFSQNGNNTMTARTSYPGPECADACTTSPKTQPFEEQHYAISYWASRWGFSAKTLREWFRDEHGPGLLRQPNLGRRSKRDYTTIMISASAAARVYAKRTTKELIH